jgi:hypothetical protein
MRDITVWAIVQALIHGDYEAFDGAMPRERIFL